MVRLDYKSLQASILGHTPAGGPIVRGIAVLQLALALACAVAAYLPNHFAVNPSHELGFLAGFFGCYALAWWSAMLYWKAMLLCALLQTSGLIISFVVEAEAAHTWRLSLVGSLAGVASIGLCLAGLTSAMFEELRDKRILKRAAKLRAKHRARERAAAQALRSAHELQPLKGSPRLEVRGRR